MRVIAGKFKGYTLTPPKSTKTRPTTDVVKEAIFCKICQEVEGANVLDLFSGTGSLGIEALSRGAEFVDFVDNNINGVMLTKKNLLHVFKNQTATNFQVYKSDCRNFLNNCKNGYDIIFLDPPYNSNLYQECLKIIFEKNLLNENGIIVCEHTTEFQFNEFQDKIFDRKKYGNTSVSYLSN